MSLCRNFITSVSLTVGEMSNEQPASEYRVTSRAVMRPSLVKPTLYWYWQASRPPIIFMFSSRSSTQRTGFFNLFMQWYISVRIADWSTALQLHLLLRSNCYRSSKECWSGFFASKTSSNALDTAVNFIHWNAQNRGYSSLEVRPLLNGGQNKVLSCLSYEFSDAFKLNTHLPCHYHEQLLKY